MENFEDNDEDFVLEDELDEIDEDELVQLQVLFDEVLAEEDDDLRLEKAKKLVEEMNGE